MNETFLKSAWSDRWTPHPTIRGIVYKRGVGYLDFTYRGRRIRYNLVENLLERCKRLKKPVTFDAEGKLVWPADEWDLYLRVIERLGHLEYKTPEPTPDTITAGEDLK